MTGRTRLAVASAVATVAAASALSAVFADSQWLMPVVGGVLVVATVSELARHSRFAAALGPVLAAIAMVFYLTALDTHDLAYAGFVPTSASLRALADLTRAGFSDVRSLATPVPTHQGLVLLAVGGLAAIALVVDLLAVTLRRAAVAGLPLLAVFALSTSLARHGVGWLPFALATSGYLWLLLTDAKDRVDRWGRTLGADTADGRGGRVTWTDGDGGQSPLSALARRVGVTAITAGLVVPLLVPGLHGGLPKSGNGPGNGKHPSRVVTLNPLVKLETELAQRTAVPLLRLTSSDPSPVYLRLTSLDRFDGGTFSPSDLQAAASTRIHNAIHGPAVSGTAVESKVSIVGLSERWLPVPTQAEVVDGISSGDWHYDFGSNTIFSASANTNRLSYTVESIRDEPAAADLERAGPVPSGQFADTLAVPPVSARLTALAVKVTKAAPTPFQKALAIQHFLQSPPFAYSTAVAPSNSTNALENFLLVTRVGFCQQYAASMAVLARMVGIPSRVAVGFTHGDRQNNGTWLVTTRDAHAWPELYFPGFGWLPFEPTPRIDGQTVTPVFAQTPTTPDKTDLPAKSQPPADRTAGLGAKQRQLLDSVPPAPKNPGLLPDAARSRGWSPWWVVLGVLVVLVSAPLVTRIVARRRRRRATLDGAGGPRAAWAELRAVAIDVGVAWSDGVTPRGSARILGTEARLDPPAQTALARLVNAEERARYAAAAGPEDGAALWTAVLDLRRSLLDGRPRSARLAATLMPRSTLRAIGSYAGRVADLLDLLDAAGARISRRLRRRVPRTS